MQAAKEAARELAEEGRRAASAATVVRDEGWPDDCGCCFITDSVWDTRLPKDILKRHGVNLESCVSPEEMETKGEPYVAHPLVAIRRISTAGHPAVGEFGLFAARYIPPRTRIVAYAGFVTDETRCSTTSDYIMRLTSSTGCGESDLLSVDAERVGNHARYDTLAGVRMDVILYHDPPCID